MTVLLLSTLLGSVLFAAAARADGLPVPVETSNSSVAAPSGSYRYIAVPADRGTTVIKLMHDGTAVIRQRFLPSRTPRSLPYAIPAVAIDGTVGGLSADGQRLTLIEPRRGFPRRTTSFVILDAGSLEIHDLFTLEGDFSFDAISRDGSTIYLAHYLSQRDPTEYEIRAYDVASGRLRPDPIVSHDIVEIQMRGMPLTRVTSPDGLWEYTAYDGNYRTPFVHALNVDSGHAACIDLTDYLGRKQLPPTLELTPGGDELIVSARMGDEVASIDTGTFAVSDLGDDASTASNSEESAGIPWFIITAAAASVLGLGFLLAQSRRRNGPDIGPLDFDPDPYREGNEPGSGPRDPLLGDREGDADLRVRR